MNYPNNDFNQNIFGAQGKKTRKMKSLFLIGMEEIFHLENLEIILMIIYQVELFKAFILI